MILHKKNILIVGTGALATMFAARLAANGMEITMLGTWQAAISALNQYGARLQLPDGTELRARVRATLNPLECCNSALALVLVKSWQTSRVAQQLLACLPDNGLVLTLQNGLGNREILAAVLGCERVMLGVTTSGATLFEPGAARMAGNGIISLGSHARSADISQVLHEFGLYNEIVTDTDGLVWGKLVINTAINPLTAILKVPNGFILETNESYLIASAIARETAGVALALGIRLPFDDPVGAVEDVLRITASNRSSMFQDVLRGAPTEIDAISGAVVRVGKSCGVPTPLNWMMSQLLSAFQAV